MRHYAARAAAPRRASRWRRASISLSAAARHRSPSSPARSSALAASREFAHERWGADALTVSELRTCRMAADGLSNPVIAQALFVTRGTVESHLHAAYRKLGISSRTDLPDANRPLFSQRGDESRPGESTFP